MGESAICIELVFMAFFLGTVVALKIQTNFWLDEPANDSTFHRSWFEEARFCQVVPLWCQTERGTSKVYARIVSFKL